MSDNRVEKIFNEYPLIFDLRTSVKLTFLAGVFYE